MNKLTDTRQMLLQLNYRELHGLADDSGVPFGTLIKIRRGETKNPRINTVEALYSHLTAPPKSSRRTQPRP